MAHSSQSETSRTAVVVAGILSIAGLATATIGAMYIAGMFGLSTAFASQIVHAVEVGGIAGAVIATARTAIARWGEKAAIA
jgi:hypothetical protein